MTLQVWPPAKQRAFFIKMLTCCLCCCMHMLPYALAAAGKLPGQGPDTTPIEKRKKDQPGQAGPTPAKGTGSSTQGATAGAAGNGTLGATCPFTSKDIIPQELAPVTEACGE
jgi:hypothetical protein